VFSTTGGQPFEHIAGSVAQIDVPGASSADISLDGATIWVGTVTQQVVAINTASLQVTSRTSIQPIAPIPNATFDRPEEILALSSGQFLVRVRQSSAAQSVLALWNPATNTLTNLNSAVPNGLGPMARTGDHTKVFVAAADSSGNLAILDSNGNIVTGPIAAGNGSISFVAASSDGSNFALVLASNGVSQIILLGGALNQIAAQSSTGVSGLMFSPDGKFLYASQTAPTPPAIQVFDGHTLQPVGEVPDASLQGVQSEIEDEDDTQLLFGISNRGVSFVDAANLATLPAIAPSFALPPVAQPSEGLAAGGAATTLAGSNFESTAVVAFGSQAATSVTVASPRQLQATSPPSGAGAAVNLAAYFPSGWLAIAPDAFSYGPQILKTLPNAGNHTGGDVIQIYGYGFGTDAARPTVTIGGAAANIQSVENVAAIEPLLGLDSTYPFALECVTLQTPAGTPGDADIVVKSANGSATAAGVFQYLQSAQVNAHPGLYKFLLYDQPRQFVYLSATDHVDVFDLKAGNFKPGGLPIYCPGRMLAGPCPDADVRGLALTPDGSQLLVADFGSQNVFLLDPDAPGTVSFVPVTSPGFGPARVAATNAQTAFVSLVPTATSAGPCSACLSQLDLTTSTPTIQPAPQPEVSSMTGTPLMQADAARDSVFLAFDAASGGSEALWTAAAPNDFTTFFANESVSDAASSADGSLFATSVSGATEIRDASLNLIGTRTLAELEQFAGGVNVPGLAMHPSGALVYQPFLTAPAPLESPNPVPNPNLHGGIDIFDAHSGRLKLRIALPEPIAAGSADLTSLNAQFLAVDEIGQRLFAITTSGLTVIQLANVPLGIAKISPPNGPAAGGTTVTVSGSGFQSVTTATVGGQKAAVIFNAASPTTLTLVTPKMSPGPQRLILTNPDNQTAKQDAAFTAN
jgi:hypothetical protein